MRPHDSGADPGIEQGIALRHCRVRGDPVTDRHALFLLWQACSPEACVHAIQPSPTTPAGSCRPQAVNPTSCPLGVMRDQETHAAPVIGPTKKGAPRSLHVRRSVVAGTMPSIFTVTAPSEVSRTLVR